MDFLFLPVENLSTKLKLQGNLCFNPAWSFYGHFTLWSGHIQYCFRLKSCPFKLLKYSSRRENPALSTIVPVSYLQLKFLNDSLQIQQEIFVFDNQANSNKVSSAFPMKICPLKHQVDPLLPFFWSTYFQVESHIFVSLITAVHF